MRNSNLSMKIFNPFYFRKILTRKNENIIFDFDSELDFDQCRSNTPCAQPRVQHSHTTKLG